MIIFSYCIIRFLGEDQFGVPKDLRPIILIRAVSGFLGITGYYVAIKMTSLSKASMLFYTNPIFTALFARIFLQEQISYYDWFSIFLAFFGIFLL